MNEVENAWKEYYDYRHELFSGPGNGCDDYRDIPDEVERKLKKLYSKAVKLEKMRGYITCKHCHGIGKIFKCWIFPKTCPYCNGLGDIWVDNIEEYFKKQSK